MESNFPAIVDPRGDFFRVSFVNNFARREVFGIKAVRIKMRHINDHVMSFELRQFLGINRFVFWRHIKPSFKLSYSGKFVYPDIVIIDDFFNIFVVLNKDNSLF